MCFLQNISLIAQVFLEKKSFEWFLPFSQPLEGTNEIWLHLFQWSQRSRLKVWTDDGGCLSYKIPRRELKSHMKFAADTFPFHMVTLFRAFQGRCFAMCLKIFKYPITGYANDQCSAHPVLS